MSSNDKPLVWLHGEVQTPPFSKTARLEAGYLLRALRGGERIYPCRSLARYVPLEHAVTNYG